MRGVYLKWELAPPTSAPNRCSTRTTDNGAFLRFVCAVRVFLVLGAGYFFVLLSLLPVLEIESGGRLHATARAILPSTSHHCNVSDTSTSHALAADPSLLPLREADRDGGTGSLSVRVRNADDVSSLSVLSVLSDTSDRANGPPRASPAGSLGSYPGSWKLY